MKLNTPTAILIGLTLIAGALFFRPPVISEAQGDGLRLVYINKTLEKINDNLEYIRYIRACRD
tara:strand:- start:251 stop:439 length:189 start_codon:yes stop_codon:yes gene_type:complete